MMRYAKLIKTSGRIREAGCLIMLNVAAGSRYVCKFVETSANIL